MNDTLSAEAVLNEKGYLAESVVGFSMYPLLKNRRDSVIVERITAPLKKYDVVLFRRDKKLVLHRIVKITKDGFIIRGDNCINNEAVNENQIIGIMTRFVRKGKQHHVSEKSYRLYSVLAPCFYPFNFIYRKSINLMKKILRRHNDNLQK